MTICCVMVDLEMSSASDEDQRGDLGRIHASDRTQEALGSAKTGSSGHLAQSRPKGLPVGLV